MPACEMGFEIFFFYLLIYIVFILNCSQIILEQLWNFLFLFAHLYSFYIKLFSNNSGTAVLDLRIFLAGQVKSMYHNFFYFY